jgi:pimeloyl-ACP methyl ester carboxylesterase
MVRVSTERSDLHVEVNGNGEPVLTIHGGFFGAGFEPLSKEPALTDRYKVITYHRHGYGKSSKPETPYTLDDVIADARAVLREVGEEQAHVVVHSAAGGYGLTMAMNYPEQVRTLTLMEPVMPTPEWGAFLQQHFQKL